MKLKKSLQSLTKAEEEVMHIIWQLGKCLVRDVIEQLGDPELPHSTVSSVVRILEKKGFVDHKAYGKTYEYFPIITKEAYAEQGVQTLVEKYFGGSPKQLVSYLVQSKDMDMKELNDLMKTLNNTENKAMAQYLFNASAIWLMSLLVYDLLLRRESYHRYNRAYLLLTLAVGAVLPLIPVLPQGDAGAALLQLPARTMATAREAVTNATPMGAAATDSMPWLAVIYLCGAAVATVVFIINAVRLAVYDRNGDKQMQGKWLVVETGMGHAPFSFRHRLYVGSVAQYTPQEWRMICRHEGSTYEAVACGRSAVAACGAHCVLVPSAGVCVPQAIAAGA